MEDRDFVRQFTGVLSILVVIAVVIFIIVKIVTSGDPDDINPLASQAIEERIKPVAEVYSGAVPEQLASSQSAPAAGGGFSSGKGIYDQVCAACHNSGVAGAPKIDDDSEWAKRLEQGKETLYSAVLNGKGAMPAKGGRPDLTDQQIKDAVDFMLGSSNEGEVQTDSQEPEAAETLEVVADSSGKGKEIYNSVCAACHNSGVAGAPKLDDSAAWQTRLQQGKDTLYESVINGKGAMPPKGGRPNISNDEIKQAVDYMLDTASSTTANDTHNSTMYAEASATAEVSSPVKKSVATATTTGQTVKTASADSSSDATQADTETAREIYDSVCGNCHNTGVAGAPRVDDEAAWQARLAQGKDTLYASAINGKGAMPIKGGRADLSNEDVKQAVDYMLARSKEGGQPQQNAVAEGPGSDIYNSICAVCHNAGLAGAPKLGDKFAWKARIDQGIESLYSNAIGGKGAMPPKGGRADLAEADVKLAVDFMVTQATEGASQQNQIASVDLSGKTGTGAEIYKSVCGNCHNAGVAGAPRISSLQDWEPRMAQGMEALYRTALQGRGAMPAKGGRADLSEREIEKAVDFMIEVVEETRPEPEIAEEDLPPRFTERGKAVYENACAVCHDKGVAGAPRLTDQQAWESRLKNGVGQLYLSAMHGKNAMPPKGGRPDLSDIDVREAVDYMIAEFDL